MKVLFLTHHVRGDDGWSRYAKDLAEGLKNSGVEVLCAVHETTDDPSIAQVQILGAPLTYIANPIVSYRTSKRLAGLLKKFLPDIVHVIVEPYGTVLPFVSDQNFKTVITAHSTYAFMPILVSGLRRLVSSFLSRKMYKQIDVVICVSKFTKNHLLGHLKKAWPGFTLASNPVVLAGGVRVPEGLKVFQDRQRERENDKREILFVGAIKPRKGILEAINALRHVQSDFIFRIVGAHNENDPYLKLIKQKISEFGLDKKVVFEGRVSEEKLMELYSRANLFLMLSTNNGADFEGYGLVYIEASLHGVPCIGPRDSGVSEAIVDGETGFLVDQYDPENVAKRISDVLDGNLISPQKCFEWALENRNEAKVKKLLEIYDGLIIRNRV
jgi:glycosyltransferase involved in cell wall biosynthesis